MTTGIQSNGTDLDSLLEPYHSGATAAITGVETNGADIAGRYQTVAAGNGTAYGATGIQSNGGDVGNIFIRIGTYSVALSTSVSPTTASVTSQGVVTNITLTTSSVTASASGGSGSYTYSWAITYNDGTGSGYAATAPTSATSAFQVTMNVAAGSAYTTHFTATVTVTDTSSHATGSSSVACTATYTNTSTCPTAYTYLANGQTASTARVGDFTRITDPYAPVEGNTVDGEVIVAEAHEAPCVRCELANGGWFECSTTAPIPTRDNGYVNAVDLVGQWVPTCTRSQLRQASIPFAWTEVTRVAALGMMPVMLIFVNHRNFWISGDNEIFVLHHNIKVIA